MKNIIGMKRKSRFSLVQKTLSIDECIKIREQIAKNIYYMNRAHNKLDGLEYLCVV